jgi:hypothetical protein
MQVDAPRKYSPRCRQYLRPTRISAVGGNELLSRPAAAAYVLSGRGASVERPHGHPQRHRLDPRQQAHYFCDAARCFEWLDEAAVHRGDRGRAARAFADGPRRASFNADGTRIAFHAGALVDRALRVQQLGKAAVINCRAEQ